MSRYIDADKLIEDISNVRIEVVGGRAIGKTIFTEAIKLYHNKILELVKECRSPNAVEVVRCKDSKHCDKSCNCCKHEDGLNRIDENHYCSYGERREG